MPFCLHCQEESTISPDADPTVCPSCGRRFDLIIGEESDADGPVSAGENTTEMGVTAFGDTFGQGDLELDEDEGHGATTDPLGAGGETSDFGASHPESDLGPTFGATIEAGSDYGGSSALDSDPAADDASDAALTPHEGSSPGGIGGSTIRGSRLMGPGADQPSIGGSQGDETHDVEKTHALEGDLAEEEDDAGGDSSDAIVLGEFSEDPEGPIMTHESVEPSSGGTVDLAGEGTSHQRSLIDLDAPSPPEGSGSDADDSASDEAQEPESSRFPTLPAEEVESGSGGSGGSADTPISSQPSDQSDRNAETIDSNTFPVGSVDRSQSRHRRPTPQQVDELDSGDTVPQELAGKFGPSQSLKPQDSVSIGSEHVRLKSHQLGRDESDEEGPDLTTLDYEFVDGPWDGGMGRVWKSKQATLNRDVAVKQIKSDKVSTRDRDRFVSEAVITGSLEHPNIIPVHDLGLDPEGLPFYSMKFVGGEGTEWEDQIRKLDEDENLSVLIQVAQAIAFAHSKNIIHMDLKPSNVMLGEFGEVLVMDWGLAARLDTGKDVQPGGTPMYMPPELALPLYRRYTQKMKGEQAGDEPDDALAQRVAPPGTYSDIYLLGALLFTIVTGRAPHRAKRSFDVLKKAARNEITRTSRRSELLDIAYKAMATDPSKRHRSAKEFIDAIKSYQEHAESITIARQASSEVRQAEKMREGGEGEQKDIYEAYARARHGYENALTLWPENRKAERRLMKTKRLYAETAFGNRDYDLALSLLDPEAEKDRELYDDVVAGQKNREFQTRWFKRLQYATAVSLAAALVFIAASIVLGLDAVSRRAEVAQLADQKVTLERESSEAKARAAAATQEAEEKTKLAEAATKEAEAQTVVAEQATAQAENAMAQAEIANSEREQAVAQREDAERRAADAEEDVAKAEKLAAEADEKAKVAQSKVDYARIRAALLEGGPYAASEILKKVPAEIRNRDDPEWNYVRERSNWRKEAEELVSVPEGAPASPAVVALSPGGEWVLLVTGKGGDSELAIAPVGEPQRVASRLRVDGEVSAAALSADGRYAAVLGAGMSVWECDSGRRLSIRTPGGARSAIADATVFAFHPTEDRLLVGTRGTAVEEWAVESSSGALVRQDADNSRHSVAVTCVGYSPSGDRRFSADGAGVVRVWDGSSDGLPWSYRHDRVARGSSQITAATLTARDDGVYLAYGCYDGAVYEVALDAAGGDDETADASSQTTWAATRPEKIGVSHSGSVASVAYARGGGLILSAGGDVILVRPAPGVVGEPVKRERRYHDKLVVACTADEEGLGYSSDSGGRVVRWKIGVPEEDLAFTPAKAAAPVIEAALRPEANAVVMADAAGFIRQWPARSDPDAVRDVFAGHADHGEFRALWTEAASPRVVTVALDGRACVWDAATGDFQRAIDLEEREVVAVAREGILIAASARRDAVAVSVADGAARTLWEAGPRVAAIEPLNADGSLLAVGLRDGQVYGWSAERGRVAWVSSVIRPHWRSIRTMRYDERRGVLLTGDSAGGVAVWRVSGVDGRVEGRYSLEKRDPVVRLESHPSGAVLAVQFWAGKARAAMLRGGQFDPIEIDNLRDACVLGESLLAVTDRALLRGSLDGDWTPIRSPSLNRRSLASVRGLTLSGESGVLLYGPGFAHQWDLSGDRPRRGVVVRSRPPAMAIAWDGDVNELRAVDAEGRWYGWSLGDSPRLASLRRLPIGGEIEAGRRGGGPSSAVLAVRSDAGELSLEVWDVSAGRRVRTIARGLSGRLEALTATADSAAVVLAEGDRRRALIAPMAEGVQPDEIELPAGSSIVGLALSPNRSRLAAVTADREAIVAERRGGAWATSAIDRTGLTAAAFSPNGSRLFVGVESGQVLALETVEGENGAGGLATRRLLTLSGHSGPITALRFAEDGRSLISGDESGNVIVRVF